MKKLIHSEPIFLLAVVFLLTACKSSKQIAYLGDMPSADVTVAGELYNARIMPKDELTISVSTSNPSASQQFNLTAAGAMKQSNMLTSQPTLITYLVDNNGNIDFPLVGNLHVAGLTRGEVEKMISEKIRPYLSETEYPIVTVRMSGYTISVLGEVNEPGIFNVTRETINIFEALARAGDMTIYGLRTNVKLIREDASGKKEVHTLNLNDADILMSPYYNLQQNDIVYVEPNKTKAQNSDIGNMTSLWFSASGILISVATLLISIFK